MKKTLASATLALCMATTALSAQTTLILGEAGPNRGARAVATQAFADDVTARTNGDLVIDIQWGGALFKADAALQGVSDGVADLGTIIGVYFPQEMIAYGIADLPLLNADELQVAGEHQVANGLAVMLAADALGLDRDAIARGLRAFRGLPGRYAPAGSVGHVRFIEDSIATRPLAVAAALRATPKPLVWIAGGKAKGASLEALVPLVAEHVDLLIGIGEAGPAFEAAFAGATRAETCSEADGRAGLHCAVERALRFLHAHHAGRGHVLLAPLAASFDQFRDYQERANVFRQVVASFADGSGAELGSGLGSGSELGSGSGSGSESVPVPGCADRTGSAAESGSALSDADTPSDEAKEERWTRSS